MKIQNISIASPVRNKFNFNINFGNQKRINNLANLNDVFEKSSLKNESKIRYYYLGADDEAHETTAPFITKQTEFGDRLYIIRSGKPRAFSGFTVEKTDNGDITTIYNSGYPETKDIYEDCEIISTIHYDPDTHQAI